MGCYDESEALREALRMGLSTQQYKHCEKKYGTKNSPKTTAGKNKKGGRFPYRPFIPSQQAYLKSLIPKNEPKVLMTNAELTIDWSWFASGVFVSGI